MSLEREITMKIRTYWSVILLCDRDGGSVGNRGPHRPAVAAVAVADVAAAQLARRWRRRVRVRHVAARHVDLMTMMMEATL